MAIELETIINAKKSIVVSRSFGRPVTELYELEEALANYINKACIKMRRQNSKAQGIEVSLVTNKYIPSDPYYRNSKSFHFDLATNNTMTITTYAKHCLRKIYKHGYRYKKVGITLLELVDSSYDQTSLLSDPISEIKHSKLMKTLDSINNRMGMNKVCFASQGVKRSWQMKAAKRSPNYTNDWNQLILVK